MTSILVVCTGNICRSPLAEQLLRARLTTAGIRATVRSAGTRAMVGGAMTPEAAALSLRYGGDPSGHQPRQLTEKLVATADLVLTATREHRGEAVSLFPRAARYAYTLRQFARLVSASLVGAGMPDATPADFLTEIAASRGQVAPPASPDDDDIEDPYRRPQAVYDRVGRTIDEATAVIVSGLGSARGRA